jgi:hypothetical protein
MKERTIQFQVFLIDHQNVGTFREIVLRMNHGKTIMNEFRKFRERFVDCPDIAGLNGVSF